MRYLARVLKKGLFGGKATVQLLAAQRLEYTWTLVNGEQTKDVPEANNFGEGMLVLVDIQNKEVVSVKDARDWVLNFVKQYLTKGITPQGLQEELDRVEQWRQSLTLQSQDLARRTVELENRREQLQELELKLNKREQKLRVLEEKQTQNR